MNQFHSSPSGMQCGGLARTKKLWDEISAAAADSAAAVQLAADEVMTEMRARHRSCSGSYHVRLKFQTFKG